MIKLISRMKARVRNDLSYYLDNSCCFNATLLAEDFINEDEPEDEDIYFDAAVIVSEKVTKIYNLNE